MATTRQKRSPAPCGAVDLDDLRDRAQVLGDVAAPALGDLQRDERGDDIADPRQVDLRPEPRDDALGEELVQPGLDSVAGDAEAAGQLDGTGPGGGGESLEQAPVCLVQTSPEIEHSVA